MSLLALGSSVTPTFQPFRAVVVVEFVPRSQWRYRAGFTPASSFRLRLARKVLHTHRRRSPLTRAVGRFCGNDEVPGKFPADERRRHARIRRTPRPESASRPLAPAHHVRLRAIHRCPEVSRWWHDPADDLPAAAEANTTRYSIFRDEQLIGFIQWYEETEPDFRSTITPSIV